MEITMFPQRGPFAQLHSQLIDNLRLRVNNGEISERRLARQIGVSQPHLHNVLKGVRNLSMDVSDAVMGRLQLTVLDLLPVARTEEPAEDLRMVQLLRDPQMEPEFLVRDLTILDFSFRAAQVGEEGDYFWVETKEGECLRGLAQRGGKIRSYTVRTRGDEGRWEEAGERLRVLARMVGHWHAATAAG